MIALEAIGRKPVGVEVPHPAPIFSAGMAKTENAPFLKKGTL